MIGERLGPAIGGLIDLVLGLGLFEGRALLGQSGGHSPEVCCALIDPAGVGLGINDGEDIALGDRTIEVDQNLRHQTRQLRADLDGDKGLDVARGGHGLGHVAALDGREPVRVNLWLGLEQLTAAHQQQKTADNRETD